MSDAFLILLKKVGRERTRYFIWTKGRLRGNIFKSAKTVHLILPCYFGDAIRYAVSVDVRSQSPLESNRIILYGPVLHFIKKNSVYVLQTIKMSRGFKCNL